MQITYSRILSLVLSLLFDAVSGYILLSAGYAGLTLAFIAGAHKIFLSSVTPGILLYPPRGFGNREWLYGYRIELFFG